MAILCEWWDNKDNKDNKISMIEKQYVIRKYVMARSIKDALKKEKEYPVEDCWIHEEWLRNNLITSRVGFKSNKKNN